MKNSALTLGLFLFVAACGGGSNGAAPASDPSTSAGTTAKPEETTAAPAPEGKCSEPKATTATALEACMAECEPLSDKAPEGSRCVPPKTQCKMNCDTKFKTAK